MFSDSSIFVFGDLVGFDPSENTDEPRKVPWIEASAEIQKRNLVVMEVGETSCDNESKTKTNERR